MNDKEIKQLRLINYLRKLDLTAEELKRINELENNIILDLVLLSREEIEFLYYLSDKYHELLP
jgi:hypothetical protein